jgi:hypothetical protein
MHACKHYIVSMETTNNLPRTYEVDQLPSISGDLHMIPATEAKTGDVLLDEDYNVIGTISAVIVAATDVLAVVRS